MLLANNKRMAKAKSKTKTKKKTAEKKSSTPRGIWNGSISFGLVNINVRVVSAKEKDSIHFTMLDPSNLSPVGYKYYNKVSGEDLKRNDTVKAFEYKPESYVVMTDADFKKANPKATQTIDIENFVELDEIDPVFFEKAYYLLPNKGGEKGYKLLCEALHKSKKVAIAKIILHTKQHLAALIPRGEFMLLELLHFAEDVKELQELGDWKKEVPVSKTIAKEVQMAEQLIEDMTVKWKPDDYEDTYRQDIMKMVKAKVKSGKATEINDEYIEEKEDSSSQVLDLMPLLRKSLSEKKRRHAR